MNHSQQPELTWNGAARFFEHLDGLTSEIVSIGTSPDNLSRQNWPDPGPAAPFRAFCPPENAVTLLPFPTGRKFSKKFFIFFPTGRNLAQISLDNSLLVIVGCNGDERGAKKS